MGQPTKKLNPTHFDLRAENSDSSLGTTKLSEMFRGHFARRVCEGFSFRGMTDDD